MNDVHFRYWTKDEIRSIKNDDHRDLDLSRNIALGVIARMPYPVHMVSGPISTGGLGCPKKNLAVFSRIIEILATEQGVNLFSQMPFEVPFRSFTSHWKRNNYKQRYCMPILRDFYHPIFLTGRIRTIHLIHGWESSFGAKWEDQLARALNIERNILPPSLTKRACKELAL